MVTYLKNFIERAHALEKSKRLSDGDRRQLEKQTKLLCHFLDVKDIKKAKRQTELLAGLLLDILGR